MAEHRSRARVSHTPGPWRVIEIGASRCRYAVKANGASYVIAECGLSDGAVALANAQLLAAAPDLLALAKQYASECAECGGCGYYALEEQKPCEDCADIRAVIARAEGREHD